MLQTLHPLHQLLEKGAETLREMSFQQAYGRDLQEAMDWFGFILMSNFRLEFIFCL